MNSVKKSLASLCTYLNLLFDIDISTEDFRLAKFNKTEDKIVPKFWKLLNFLTLNDKIVNTDRIKEYLQSINYRNSRMCSSSDFIDEGSRELLIAVGFVLPDGLQMAVDRETECSPFNPKFGMLLENDETKILTDVSAFTSERDFQRYSDWLKTRVILNSKEIAELKIQNKKLLEKIKNSYLQTEGCSVNEILSLNCEKYAKIFIEETEKLTQILINHQEWTKNETAFWQWMIYNILKKLLKLEKLVSQKRQENK